MGSVVVNLVAYIGDTSIPFYVQKKILDQEEYDNEIKCYDNLERITTEEMKPHIIQKENSNDDNKEIYFSYGKCTLLELANYYKC